MEIIELKDYNIEINEEIINFINNKINNKFINDLKQYWKITPQYLIKIIIFSYSTIRLNLKNDKNKNELISF